MKWNELSNEAKGIIEWVEDPCTNQRKTLEISIGEYFEQKTRYKDISVKIMVTKEVYDEVVKYVECDKELESAQFPNSYLFRIKKESALKLH